jgi:putative salt-induced outer membrane protein
MTQVRRFFAVMTIVLAVGSPAIAEDATKSPWTGSAELSYVATSGNTDTSSLGLGGELHYKPGIWTYDFKLSYVEAETDGEKSAEKFGALFAASRPINERLDYYARVVYLSDEFAGIDSNISGDTGVIYKALTGEKHFLDLGAGVGYTSESRTIGDDSEFATGTAFAKYKYAFSKNAEFTDSATYIHDFEDSDNWRFLNSAAVSAAINTIFSLKAYYNVVHLNAPVPGFEETDSTTGVSLVAKF